MEPDRHHYRCLPPLPPERSRLPSPSEKGSFASENLSLAFVGITTPLPNLGGEAGAGLIRREVVPSLLNVIAWVQLEIHWWEMLEG